MLFGYSSDEILDILKKFSKKIKYVSKKNVLKLFFGILFQNRILIKGFNSGNTIRNLINEFAEKKKIKNINEIKKELIIPSVDLKTGDVICFYSKNKRRDISNDIHFVNNIDIGRAVQSSCSYPGVFEPCYFEKYELVDGGIRENIPWKELNKVCNNKIICVTFEKRLSDKKCKNLIDVFSESITLLKKELTNYELEGAEFLIKIRTEKIGLLEYEKIDELYKMGYTETKKHMNEIKKYLSY